MNFLPYGNCIPFLDSSGGLNYHVPEEYLPKWNIPHTYEELMIKANTLFERHAFKENIICLIEEALHWYRMEGHIMLMGYSDEAKNSEKTKAINDAVDSFFNNSQIFAGIPSLRTES